MADETPSAVHTGAGQTYKLLRWMVRITGILIMFAGGAYLGAVVSSFISQKLGPNSTAGDNLYAFVISIVALGVGIFVLRTGLKMFRTVDASAISHFAFVFTLVFTFVLMQILPLSGLIYGHLYFMALLVALYFGLSFWVLKWILLQLLLPPGER